MMPEPVLLFEPAAGFNATERTETEQVKLKDASQHELQMVVNNVAADQNTFGYKKQVCIQTKPDDFTCPICGGSLYFPRIYVMQESHYRSLKPPYYPCNQYREGNGYQK